MTDVLRHQIARASEISVSFPDIWEYAATVEQDQKRIYVAAFPIERASNSRDHFHGLGPEINVNLVFYRLYKFFQPWPMPRINVAWDPAANQGTVSDSHPGRIRMQPIGQAQTWFGFTHSVLWECYLNDFHRHQNWQELLVKVWQEVERDCGAEKFYTAPQEPAFPEGYRDFLMRLGYTKDAEYPVWWSKTGSRSRALK